MNPYSASDSPAENISRAMEYEFLTMTGEFKVGYCGSEKGRRIFSIRSNVLREVTKDQVRRNIYKIVKTSQTLHKFGIQKHNTELIVEMHCNENTTTTNNHTFFWPMTKVGTTAKIICGANVATRLCSSSTAVLLEMPTSQNMTSPQCSPFTGIWEEPDISQCYNTEWITRQLKDIKCQDIDKQNIDTIAKELLGVSEKSMYFKEEDINLVIAVHEEMMPLISNVTTNVTVNDILLSINNVINTPEEILVVSEQANKSVNRMLNVIGTIPENVLLKEQQLTVLYDNLGVGVAKVEKVFNGLFYGILYETNETEAKNVVYNSSYPDLELEDITLMDYISLPKNILNHLQAEERSSVSRISFYSMRDDKLYTVIQKSRNERISKINSHIIASNIPNIQITKLDEPVTISFNLIHENATNPQCVYWDETPGQDPHWSTKGCNASNYVPGEKVLCFCNHLTSFALLMDVYQNERNIKNSQLLSIISNTGCGISFVFLILTVIVHVYFKKLWKLTTSKILVNLCISLAVTNFIFLIGMQVYIAKITAVCKTVAALLHYFLLTTVIWMTVEAVHVYLSVVVVFRTRQESFLMWSSILAWCLPAVIVIITLAINYTNNYIRIAQVCWLSKTSFYAAFLSPVAIVLTVNLTVFFLVIWRLISVQNKRKFEHKARKVRVLGFVGLFFLLGICLTLAFFAFGEAAEVFKFLFVIFNTFQGSFIFVFYCVYKKDTRDVIRKDIYKRKRMNLRNYTTSRGSSSTNEANKTANTKL
ncbi:adhesion G-protein coupled receptor G6-like [Octopus sinensis]|uniref:Adhesion G-protein coupled receptor G6-like n=1 Tax=Octopus sinensis TaxID=2607531 RepID=A0A7E6F830_9MOLL|nr:adhesion G-protein coupled receptor G6-like [Octopus sinensis]